MGKTDVSYVKKYSFYWFLVGMGLYLFIQYLMYITLNKYGDANLPNFFSYIVAPQIRFVTMKLSVLFTAVPIMAAIGFYLGKSKDANLILERQNQEILEINEELSKLDKAKDELMAKTTNQLKVPISSLKSYTELLLSKDYGKINSDQKMSLEVAYKHTERFNDLIMNIIELNKCTDKTIHFDSAKVDVKETVDKAIKELKKEIKVNNVVVKNNVPNNTLIKADREKIQLVLEHLLSNSVKFTQKNGKADISATKKGKRVEISIKDNGIGIEKKSVKNIFSKFYQVDQSDRRRYNGTGLGLAICKGIIEKLGGKIVCISDLGKGTEMRFSLPIAK